MYQLLPAPCYFIFLSGDRSTNCYLLRGISYSSQVIEDFLSVGSPGLTTALAPPFCATSSNGGVLSNRGRLLAKDIIAGHHCWADDLDANARNSILSFAASKIESAKKTVAKENQKVWGGKKNSETHLLNTLETKLWEELRKRFQYVAVWE